MRITQKGKENVLWTGKWYCQYCNCQWELDTTDPAPKRVNDYQGDFYEMKCPHCEKYVTRDVAVGGQYDR